MKDKLIELLDEALAKYRFDAWENSDKIADHLIANGGTVQRWIPVGERLPESNGAYLVYAGRGNIDCVRFAKDLYKVDPYDFSIKKGKSGFYIYDSEYGFDVYDGVTHWMPLPEPPKEDAHDG